MNSIRTLLLAGAVLAAGCASTPLSTDRGITGGTQSTQVAPDMWRLSTSVNGWTPVSQLKPQMLLHLTELGRSKGYASFELGAVVVLWNSSCDCYGVHTRATFSKSPPTPGQSFGVGMQVAYDPVKKETRPAGSATLKSPGRSESGSMSILVEPVLFDALGFGHGTMSAGSDEIYYLQPGANRILAFSRSFRGLLGNVRFAQHELTVQLEPDKVYRLAGRPSHTAPEVWVEDMATGQRVGEVVGVSR